MFNRFKDLIPSIILLLCGALLCTGCADQAASAAQQAAESEAAQAMPAVEVEMVEAIEYDKAPMTEEELQQALEVGSCPTCKSALTAHITAREDAGFTEENCNRYLHGTDKVCWEKVTYVQHCDTCDQDVGDAREALLNTQTVCYGWTAGSRCSKTGQMVPAVTNASN